MEETSNFTKYSNSGVTIGVGGMIPAGKEHHDTNGRHQDQKKQRKPAGAILLFPKLQLEAAGGAEMIGTSAADMTAWTEHGNHLTFSHHSTFGKLLQHGRMHGKISAKGG